MRRGGISYTVDTIRTLKGQFLDAALYFIIRSDNLREITIWRDYRLIIDMVIIAVAHRPGFSMDIPLQLSGTRIIPFPSPEMEVSSTQIRSRLARDLPCESMMPASCRL